MSEDAESAAAATTHPWPSTQGKPGVCSSLKLFGFYIFSLCGDKAQKLQVAQLGEREQAYGAASVAGQIRCRKLLQHSPYAMETPGNRQNWERDLFNYRPNTKEEAFCQLVSLHSWQKCGERAEEQKLFIWLKFVLLM